MKKAIELAVIFLSFLLSWNSFSQNDNEPRALGLPGDNLNLYAVLDVFQKSKTLEDFEKAINDKEININNLDLNNDNFIDYIKVVSEKQGNTTFIILQVLVNEKEIQDVAVIQVSKDNSGKIAVQIIGDEELYGKNYIIEPSNLTATKTPNPGYKGEEIVTITNNTTTNYYSSVDEWPIVLFLYSPAFVVYTSPFYWGYYPVYWHPWPPIYFHVYWGYHSHYYRGHHYHRTVGIRNPNYYHNYYIRRSASTVVNNNRRMGNYNATYNGRTYRKPEIPAKPSTTRRPSTRPEQIRSKTTVPPTNRPEPIRSITPKSSKRSLNKPSSSSRHSTSRSQGVGSRSNGGNQSRNTGSVGNGNRR